MNPSPPSPKLRTPARADGRIAFATRARVVPVFIGAVLAGNVARLPYSTLNAFALFYLTTRVVYNAAYINVTSRKWSFLRSGAWFAGAVSMVTVYIKSGNALNKF